MKTIIKISLITIVLVFSNVSSVFSQLTVLYDGSVDINSYTANWGRAIRTTVHNPNACAYHLTYNGSDKFWVHASGYVWCTTGFYTGSDLKLKQNVSKINSPLSTVLKLNGVQFDYIDDNNPLESKSPNSNGHRIGLIAQEVEKVIPGIVLTLPDSTKAVAYSDLIALLIEAMKEQQLTIDNLQIGIQNLNEKVLKNGSQDTNTQNNVIQSSDHPTLSQNKPNPFNQTTEIKYYLPYNAKSANIFIYDLNGSQLKGIPIENNGEGSIVINGSELRAGIYYYVLIVDGREIDSKKMILTN